MSSLLNYVMNIFSQIVGILNRQIFPDMPITYLELILGCIIIKFVFSFIFGGFKEVSNSTNSLVKGVVYSNNKKQILDRKLKIIESVKSSKKAHVYKKGNGRGI